MAVSVAILVALALPFTPARDPAIGLIPPCEWKTRYSRECPFCGMTTSFLDISEGHLDAAQRVNRAGIPLYVLFVSNELCALAFLRRKRAPSCK